MSSVATPSNAVASFLLDVEEFSADYLKTLGLSPQGSPNGGGKLTSEGIVLHYTVDQKAESVVRWLCDPASRSSAHFVIAQGRVMTPPVGRPEQLANNAYFLPASIIQLRKPSATAWHATWANDLMLGVEMCNGGEIRFNAAGTPHTCRGSDGWQPTAGPYVNNPLKAGGRTFCGYNNAQLSSLALLCYALCQQFKLPLDEIVGHDMVQGRFTPGSGGHDKRDCGGFDFHLLRAQLSQMHADDFWSSYRRAPNIKDGPPQFGCQSHFAAVGVNASADWAMRCQVKNRNEQAIYQVLRDLGYAVTRLGEKSNISQANHYALFQHMMGLMPDGVMGPLTRAALCTRHVDRLSVPLPIARGDSGA